MIDKLNKCVSDITRVSLDMREIMNGAIVDPKTGNLLKDRFGNTVFYKDSKGYIKKSE